MSHTKPSDPATTRDAQLMEIAELHLFLETLETRNSDALDFHDASVWAIRSALEAAFEAGRRAGSTTVSDDIHS